MEEEKYTLEEAGKRFAIQTNMRTWELLEKPEPRIELEDDELLYAAFASAYHWLKAGTGLNHQRAEYMITRAYIALGQPENALHHGARCIALTKEYASLLEDFDFAFAYEIYARALAMNGHLPEAKEFHTQARHAGDQIQNDEDKKIFDKDMAEGFWFGLE